MVYAGFENQNELIFFYKQKTAYEMRISDWSSDVCSSDLQRGIAIDPTIEAKLYIVASQQRIEQREIKCMRRQRSIAGPVALCAELALALRQAQRREGNAVAQIEDRKSTRLNYSH